VIEKVKGENSESKIRQDRTAIIAWLKGKRNFTDAILFSAASMSTPATIKGSDSKLLPFMLRQMLFWLSASQ
jgi:hypothetical protein